MGNGNLNAAGEQPREATETKEKSREEAVGIAPEQRETVAEQAVEELEKNYHLLTNLQGSIESYRSEPRTDLEKLDYRASFELMKLSLLGNFRANLIELAKKNPGATKAKLLTEAQALVDEATQVLKAIAKRGGYDTQIGLPALKNPPTSSELARLPLQPAQKAKLAMDLRSGADFYTVVRRAPLLEPERDTPEQKRQKEAVVATALEKYLTSILANLPSDDPRASTGFAEILHCALSETVGDGKLSLDTFENVLAKLKSGHGEIFDGGENSRMQDLEQLITRASEQSGEDGHTPEKYLIRERVKLIEGQTKALLEQKSNPYGLTTAKYGGLKYVLLFAAEKWIYATVGLNFLLHGTDIVKNPTVWWLGGAAGAIYYHNNPDAFKGKPEHELSAKEDLRSELENLSTKNPVLANWLSLVEEKDLAMENPIKNSLGAQIRERSQAGKYWIGSAELSEGLSQKQVPKDWKAVPTEANDPNARELYRLLKACQKYELNPKTILKSDS